MSKRDDERMAARRDAFLRDLAVFRSLHRGDLVRVLIVSSSWEPYQYPVKKVIVMRVLSDAALSRSVCGVAREVDVETTAGPRRRAVVHLRDEADATRTTDGRVEHSLTGSPNVVLVIWRDRNGSPTTGAWVHLERCAEPQQLALGGL